MAQIPAICKNCGLIFPSPLPVLPGISTTGSIATCPRCRGRAPILDGYATIIDGLVAFITSPNSSIADKKLLIDTAKAVAKGEIKAAVAARQLDSTNKESGRLFREWAIFGMTFLSALATVASLVLDYAAYQGNTPLEQVAVEKFEEIIAAEKQPITSSALAPTKSARPSTSNLAVEPKLEGTQSPASNANAPNENRKARRARIKENRAKLQK